MEIVRSAARGAVVGSVGGAITGVVSGGLYVVTNLKVKLPWAQLAPAFLGYVVIAGGALGSGVALGIALVDWMNGGVRRDVLAVLGAVVGGAIAGVVPGIVGAAGFGALPFPFMGGEGIVAVPVLGALYLAIALADQDRRARGDRTSFHVDAALAVGVGLVLALVAALVTHEIGNDALLDELRLGAQRIGLVTLGALGGAGLGAGLGLYIGGVVLGSRIASRR